jgi:hypothetical protein
MSRRPALVLVVLLAALPGCTTLRNAFTSPPPVTVAEIVDMSKAGVPPSEIVAAIQDSGTVYRLSASELANLHAQGVSDQVIDEMQRTYLHSVAENQAMEDWGMYSMGPDGFWYGGAPYGWGGWPGYYGGPGWVAVPRR